MDKAIWLDASMPFLCCDKNIIKLFPPFYPVTLSIY